MDVVPEPHSLTPSRETKARGKIEFIDLSFRYDDKPPYLYEGFSLTVEPGQCIALMGPSGSGKSTLTKLLQGFYFPNDRRVLVDGRDTRFLSANELRAPFGVVLQETTLFSGTIYENLILGNPHADFADVLRACKFAEIHDFIEQLPEGYKTTVGERGVGLSGGQKQRIAIARALLKRPKVRISAPVAPHSLGVDQSIARGRVV